MQPDVPYTPASKSLGDYLQYYGLALDPFVDDPDFPFFGGGQRRQLLEQLLDMCQFSASVLAVLGEPGVGKTRIAHALLQAFSGEQDICHLTAQPGCTAEQVLSAIAGGFGLGGEEARTEGQLLASLRRFSQSADELDSLALLVIDDAHHLDDKTLGALLSILQGQALGGRRLHIALFALPALADRLDQIGMNDILAKEFFVDSLSLAEATDYLNFRLEVADYLGPELFNEARVERWWRRSAGSLAQLHEHARQWLCESAIPVESTERREWPLVHIGAVALLLVVLVVGLLFRGGSAPPEPEPLVLEPRLRTISERPPLPAPQPIAAAPVVPSEPGLAVAEPQPDTQVPPVVPPPPGAVAPAVPAPAQNQPAPQAATPVPAPAPREPSAVPARPQLPEDEQVLLSWRASEYTLQILGSGSEQAVRDYMARQTNRQQLLMYKTRRENRDWYVVVSGRYPSSESARAAIANLPAEQRQASPWGRQLSGIQQEIERERGL